MFALKISREMAKELLRDTLGLGETDFKWKILEHVVTKCWSPGIGRRFKEYIRCKYM